MSISKWAAHNNMRLHLIWIARNRFLLHLCWLVVLLNNIYWYKTKICGNSLNIYWQSLCVDFLNILQFTRQENNMFVSDFYTTLTWTRKKGIIFASCYLSTVFFPLFSFAVFCLYSFLLFIIRCPSKHNY